MITELELVKLLHIPLRLVRTDVVGEVVYSETWIRLMNTESDRAYNESGTKIEEILRVMPSPISQRMATVMASVVCWFGTNCGRAFLKSVEQKYDPNNEKRYLIEWSIENFRERGINSSVRTLEHIMMERPVNTFRYGSDWQIPNLSADDYETVEHLMRWIVCAEGQEFIKYCEKTIDDRQNEIRAVAYNKWKEANL